jgi:uncharacterized protein YndB with AHSA1/START domain
MSETHLQHTIEIARPPRAVYDYVTQPWRWHEWHPSSRAAQATTQVLQPGDEFDEQITLRPLAPWPPALHRHTHYRVLEARPGEHWEVAGRMRDGWLQLRYDLTPSGTGTRFTRTLRYGAQGASRLLLPLLRRRQADLSQIALANLKRRLESQPDA